MYGGVNFIEILEWGFMYRAFIIDLIPTLLVWSRHSLVASRNMHWEVNLLDVKQYTEFNVNSHDRAVYRLSSTYARSLVN